LRADPEGSVAATTEASQEHTTTVATTKAETVFGAVGEREQRWEQEEEEVSEGPRSKARGKEGADAADPLLPRPAAIYDADPGAQR